MCVLKVGNSADGLARKAVLAAFGAEMNRMLYCVAVDEDVNIHDWQDVLWAMSTRCRADRDIFQIPDIPSFSRDPHRIHWGRLGIDATKPIEHAEEFERKQVPGLNTLDLGDYLN
jgi:4-hydroxybenzoate decarboxylase